MVDGKSEESRSSANDPGEKPERGRAYPADGITVYFNARLCQHSGVCLRGLPKVFDVDRRPWIRSALDTPEIIATQIDRCPSGALSYDLHPADRSST